MSLKAGIIGLPNVGKSTLFSALTKKQVESSNYAFTTIEPNISTVILHDKRLEKIAQIVNTKKIIHATFDFVDIAGLVQGASKGEGLGNKFLANIREVDAIIHVLRCFEDKEILHVNETVNPIRDLEIINLELMLADLETVHNVINRIDKKAKSGIKSAVVEQLLASRIKKSLEKEIPVRNLDLNEEETKIVKGYHLLSAKPVIYVLNMSSTQILNPIEEKFFKDITNYLSKDSVIIPICVQIESELLTIENNNEKIDFLSLYNIEESGLNTLTKEAFKLLNLETYFTAGEIEVRAWVYKKGMYAPQCAGIIHTDFEKKFIKAEIIAYDDYISLNGESNAKNAGKMRQEGKTYIMKDGDICFFRFGK